MPAHLTGVCDKCRLGSRILTSRIDITTHNELGELCYLQQVTRVCVRVCVVIQDAILHLSVCVGVSAGVTQEGNTQIFFSSFLLRCLPEVNAGLEPNGLRGSLPRPGASWWCFLSQGRFFF